MGGTALADKLDGIVRRLRAATWKERDAVKDELLGAVRGSGDPQAAKELLEQVRKDLSLELRWEVDEVLEALAPPPASEPEPEPEPEEEPDRPLGAGDLVLVYDDPRGLMLYKSKQGDRWFASQVNPHTGQPQTFELHPQEVTQLKGQLLGSPYWVLGSGEAPSS